MTLRSIDRRCWASVWFLAVGFVFAVASPTECTGSAQEEWIGKRVILRAGAGLSAGKQTIDVERPGSRKLLSWRDKRLLRSYEVKQAKTPWLLVAEEFAEGPGTRGWALVTDLVPYEQAADHFTREIARDPKNAWNFINRSIILSETGQADSARADCERAVELDPTSAAAFIHRGISGKQSGQYDKAIADFDKAVTLEPRSRAWALLCRAQAWDEQGESEKAIADYNEVIHLEPQFAIAYMYRSSAWETKKDLDKALGDLTEALRLVPDWDWPLYERARIWLKMKEYEKVSSYYRGRLKVDPQSWVGHYDLAWLCATCPDERIRDGKLALGEALEAQKLLGNNRNPYVLRALAAAHAETGDFDSAIKCQESANALPENSTKARELGRKLLECYTGKKPYRLTGEE